MSEVLNEDNERKAIRDQISSAIGKAALKNLGLATFSVFGAFIGGGTASLAEATHDYGDSGIHGIEFMGSKRATEKAKMAARRVSAAGILGGVAYVGYKSGIDLMSNDAHTPGWYATGVQTLVAAGNRAVHRHLDDDVHEIEHRIEAAKAAGIDVSDIEGDVNLEGSHRHTWVDSWVSPGLAFGMAISEATGRPEIANVFALAGAGATLVGNAELYVRQESAA
jgi:divalent metal cation (Fe/Co/Zn/Cd) transporter